MALANCILLGFAAVAVAANASAAGCHHDDCFRGVNSTHVEVPSLGQRQADCAAMLITTVIPETVTSTITTIDSFARPTRPYRCGGSKTKTKTKTRTRTEKATRTKYKNTKTVTATTTVTVSKCAGKRAVINMTAAPREPPKVPVYATGYCGDFAAYSSVCACIVEPTTVVLPAPTTTVFVAYTGSQRDCGGR